MEENNKSSSPDTANPDERATEASNPDEHSTEVSNPDECATEASNPDEHSNPDERATEASNPDERGESITAVASATDEDQQINLLTKSYLARLNVMDNSEDDDLEEYERGDDDPGLLSAISSVNN